MKTLLLIWVFLAVDLSAYFSVPRPDRLQWQYVIPGGGLVALYKYTHTHHAP